MIHICGQCKLYRADKEIDLEGSTAVCPECGYANRTIYQPLFIVCGASAAGKSTVCRHLTGNFSEVIVLEGDILWQKELNSPENGYRVYFETWLRLAKNIGYSGRPTALFMSGGLPQNIIPCIESRYFSHIYYLGLVCDHDSLATRLRARPEWRGGYPDDKLQEMINFNQWIIDNGPERGIDLLDTSCDSVAETTDKVKEWMLTKLEA